MPVPTPASTRPDAHDHPGLAAGVVVVQPTLFGDPPGRPEPFVQPVPTLDGLVVSEPSTAFQHHRCQPWVHGEPMGSGWYSMRERIESFRPVGVDARTWNEIAHLVQDWVSQVGVTAPSELQRYLTPTALHVAWCQREAMDLRPSLVWHYDTIESFVVNGLVGREEGTRSSYRSALRTVGEHVLGPDAAPMRQTIISRSDPEVPYSAKEFSGLLTAVRFLTTPHLRENASVLVHAGAGAGLSTSELSATVGTDFRHAHGGLEIHITYGPRPRVVPVREEFEDVLAERAEQVGECPIFMPDRTRMSRKDVSQLLDRLKFPHLPSLTMQRLRVTWIVDRLLSGADPRAVAAAAGVGESQISRYWRFLPDLEAEEIARQMRRRSP